MLTTPAETTTRVCLPPRRGDKFHFLLVLAAICVCLSPAAVAFGDDWVERNRVGIQALDSARTTTVSELQEGSLSAREVADYQDFLAYLNTRIFAYCQQLARAGGEEAVAGLPCPSGTMMSGNTAEPADQQAQDQVAPLTSRTIQLQPETAETRTEKTGKLQDEFLESLGTFDQMLLGEEEKMAARVPSQREAAGAGGHSGGNAGKAVSDGEPGAGEMATAEGPAAAVEEEASPGVAGHGQADQDETGVAGVGPGAAGGADTGQAKGGVPAGTRPPPQDDDIVARQLREAAEKETDPELKKRLWEEYWRYKGVDK